MLFNKHQILFVLLVLFLGHSIYAQENPSTTESDNSENIDQVVDGISRQLENNNSFFESAEETVDSDSQEITIKDKIFKDSRLQRADYKNLRTTNYSNYIGAVQKNILNKTGRLQFFGSFATSTNDIYYRTIGLQGNISYHFNEKYGVSAFGYAMTSTPRSEIKDIEANQGLTVDSLVYLQSYYGLSLYLNTIYGKMSLFNEKIVPFELFFNFGGGTVNTKHSSGNPGLHAGVGSLFTLDENSGIKFDLNWLFYSSKNLINETSNSNSIILSVGYSYFLGEAR